MKNFKSARVVWSGDKLNFDATLGSGYQLKLGSNPDETSGSPMELLLAGVAGCTAVDVVSMLRKMRQNIEGVEVEIKGARADDYPKVYTDAELVYIVRGSSIDADAVERAINLSKEKYCSASIMFKNAGVNFSSSYRIEEVLA
ncbi:MAG: OsmC family protein [Chloroflexi bacterium]|nr:OsmC family protein [Chloroflexota bacterium]